MSEPLNVLVLEDCADDAELNVHELRRAGFEPHWKRVENEADYRAALDTLPDVILADYSLPQFNGLRALKILRERGLDIPFILISGTLGEEAAVEAMKQGANDYLLKDRIARLGSAVAQALEQRRLGAARRLADEKLAVSESRYRRLFEANKDGIVILDAATGKIDDVNPAAIDLLGVSLHDMLDKRLSELGVFQAGAFDFDALRNVPGDRFAHSASVPLETKRGRALLMEIMGQAYTVNGKRLTQCNFRDITARKRAEEQARRNLELAEHSREALAIALEDRQQDEAALRANEKSHYWLAAAVEQAVETIVVTDAIGTILYANPAFEKATGYTCAEVLGKNSRILKSGQHDAAFYRRLWDVLTSGQVWRGHFVNRRKDGTLYQVGATISPVRDASGTIVNYVSVHRNCEPYPAA